MSGFFWNVRGFNHFSKHSVIRQWVKNNNFLFGGLLETRVKEKKAQRIVDSVFEGWSFMANYEHHWLGRIWIVWKDSLRLTPIFKSDQLITVLVLMEGRREEFFCTFVYASNSGEERKKLWEDLRNHHDSPMFKNKPWMISGDLNEILQGDEHSNYVASSPSTGMVDFRELVRHCSLTDLGYQGSRLTWCNKQEVGLICKKLDRLLVNERWMDDFPQSYCIFESGGCSDHARGRFYLEAPSMGKRKPFKFVNVLTKMPQFLPEVSNFWKETTPLFVSTSSLHRFSKKLKAIKPVMRVLSKEKLGDLSKRTKVAYEELCLKQSQTLLCPNSENMLAESLVYEKWKHLSTLEEAYLKQKSKLHWLAVGDKNNSYFHNSIKVRRMHNQIREITTRNGVILTDGDEIKKEAEDFFNSFLNHKPTDYNGMNITELQALLKFQCSEIDKGSLLREVTDEEIKKVLFSMPNDKSPGPDGFTSEFFKASWPIIEKDFLTAIKSFFVKGFLPKGVNSTILALIPKKDDVKKIRDYRPISCCNVLYKVISKILANRLKVLLPRFIRGNQSAFVKDRLLMENLLLATELVKDYHKESVSPRCAMKIDISKVFDSVQWDFVLNTLLALDFPQEFVHWIRLCITTTSFSVQVNGELAGYFGSARGLRQGCSLSPYLFVICMNVLSRMLDKVAVEKRIGFHPKCENIHISHLCFADDLMIFVDGTKHSIEEVIKIFGEFATCSGLKISLEKSTLYLAGVSEINRRRITEQFPFAEGSLHVRYLGLPLLTKRISAADYDLLLEKIRLRMSSWTSRYLSYAGRLQLLQSVIVSTVNFWIQAFRLQNQCIRKIEGLCAAFLWLGPDLNPKKSKVAWQEVCRPKKEGRLGLKSLKEANIVSCLKLIWRIVSNTDSLWVKWIKNTLLRNGSMWSVRESKTKGSWMWRKLLKFRALAQTFHKVEVGNGETTFFWHDVWSSLGKLSIVAGLRGPIDMSISIDATVSEVLRTHRRRRHRVAALNMIEDELCKLSQERNARVDTILWRYGEDKFKKNFTTKEIWDQIRIQNPTKNWYIGVWFTHATPKYSFFTWLATLDRLSTGDRMKIWAGPSHCVLCNNAEESRNHLFFMCSFSSIIWKELTWILLGNKYTTRWDELLSLTHNGDLSHTRMFLFRYTFQATIYHLWRERNNRRHGEPSLTPTRLSKIIDKTIRNRLSSLRQLENKYHNGLEEWFAIRRS